MIVDELVTILGLKLAADALINSTRFGQALKQITQYAAAASAAVTATAAAVAVFAERTNHAGTELYRLEKATGMNTDSVQALGFALGAAGGNAKGIAQDIESLTLALNPVLPGEYNSGIFWLLGADNLSQAKRGIIGVEDEIKILADRLHSMKPQEAFSWGSKLPISRDMLQLMMEEGSAGINRLMGRAKQLGAILTPGQQKQAKAFTAQVNELKWAWEGLENQLGTKLSPTFTRLISLATEWLARNKELIASGLDKFVRVVGYAFDKFVTTLQAVGKWVMKTFPDLTKLAKGLDWVSVAGNALYGVMMVLTAFLAVQALTWAPYIAAILALGLVIEDLFVYLNGGESVIGTIIDKFKKWLDQFPELKKFTKELFGDFKRFVEEVGPAMIDTLMTIGYWLGQSIKGWGLIFDAIAKAIDKMLEWSRYQDEKKIAGEWESDNDKAWGGSGRQAEDQSYAKKFWEFPAKLLGMWNPAFSPDHRDKDHKHTDSVVRLKDQPLSSDMQKNLEYLKNQGGNEELLKQLEELRASRMNPVAPRPVGSSSVGLAGTQDNRTVTQDNRATFNIYGADAENIGLKLNPIFQERFLRTNEPGGLAPVVR